MRLFNRKPKEDMSYEQFEALAQESIAWLKRQQQQWCEQFNMDQYERFDLNPHTGELTFSNSGIPKVVAKVQFAGSLSIRSNTWLWSWANDSMPDHAKQDILRVKKWGEQHGAFPLTNRGFEADDEVCYSLAAICAKLLDAKGFYRAPGPNVYAYLIITDVRWA